MTDELTEAELAEALRDCGVEVGYAGSWEFRNVVADRFLNHPWLADRVAVARAEALTEAADAVHSRFEHSLLNTEECEWVENWLRDRAAAVARDGEGL